MPIYRTHPVLRILLLASLVLQPVVAQQKGDTGAPVTVARPEITREAPAFTFTGSITVRRQASLSPRVPGLVLVADAELGDVVEAGDTLVQLDSTLAEIELSLLESDLALARAEKEDARRLLEEAHKLGDSNFPRSERLSRETDLEMAEVSVLRAKAAVEAEREEVRRHKVIAPFSGIVARKLAEMGEWVETGDPVIELVGREHVRLEVSVPQEQIQVALQTETVEIRLPGLPDSEITGRVAALSPSVEPGTRSLVVRVEIENPPETLKPGMSAVAVFRPQSDEAVLLIPRDAVVRSAEGETYVWLVRKDGDEKTVTRRTVELGATRGNRIAVLSGLTEEDDVVVRGNESLREDQRVRRVDAPPPAGIEGI